MSTFVLRDMLRRRRFITARVAKQAKVMFSQACVTHSVQHGGGGGGRCATTKVYHPPGHNTSLPPDTTPPSLLDTAPAPPGTMHRQAVRILLECILVNRLFSCNNHLLVVTKLTVSGTEFTCNFKNNLIRPLFEVFVRSPF